MDGWMQLMDGWTGYLLQRHTRTHSGSKLKEVGTLARADLEAFFGKQVYLEMRVKVRKGWRENEKDLKAFGYAPTDG